MKTSYIKEIASYKKTIMLVENNIKNYRTDIIKVLNACVGFFKPPP